ncbi:MAG TPA: alpha/beta hydrolase [Arenimonas sp.]|uniref:alpha/beta fold hydrolase n=1 Tax=Arenimonas sp. TaxID=1872635 RepID=UPI002D7E453A|nr:alpha/beta hydrolase [Arenimonas sp.]HEU0153514.1 alpha/beta hydrolase [Arenimonas sp.]
MPRLVALLLCLLVLPAAAGAQPFANSRFETLDGVKVHVRHWPAAGDAPGCPVLLVHGLGGSTFSFRTLAPALAAAGHPVWAIDLPAYGYSAREPFPGTAGEALAPWLAAQAPGTAWCLLGHSMGTRVVGELVRSGQVAVEHAVYVAGNPILSERELKSRERYRSPRIRRWLASLVESRYLDEDRFGKLLAKAYGRDPTAEEVQGYLSPLKTPGTALAIMTGYSAEFPVNPRGEELDHVPSLILWGENDAWVKPEVADRLQAALPSAQRVTIAGAGHSPMETHPDQTRAAVLARFRDAPAVAATAR